MSPEEAIMVLVFCAILSGIVSYLVSWIIVHDAIDNERRIQERKRERTAMADWEKTHIPDDTDLIYRRRR